MSTKINIILVLEGLAKVSQGLNRAAGRVDDFNRGMAGARNAALGVVGAIGAIGATSLKSAAGLEKSLDNVEAKSGATADQMARLKDQAIALGGSTKFSAQEAADGMGFLAQAGFNAEQILTAMPSSLALAAAGGLDLARSADIASNVLSGFGLEAAETERVADVLAQAAAKSNVSVEQLGETMKYVAPIAKAAGVSLEEAATFAGLLGNAGIQGSQAGTAMRAAISRLSAPPKPAREALEALGVDAKDAEGNLRPLPDILGDLQGAMKDLGTAEQIGYLSDIFGMEAASSMKVLLDSTANDGFKNLADQINNAAGAAQNMAEVQSDNLEGDITALGSAFDTLKTAIGDEFLAVAREVVQWVTDMIRAFTALDGETRKQIIRWGLIAGAVALGILAVVALGLALSAIITVFSVLGAVAGAVWAIVFSPIALIGLAIAALAYLIYKHWDEIKAFTATTWEAIRLSVFKVLAWFTEEFPKTAAFIGAVWEQIKETALLAWEVIKAGVAGIIEGIQAAFSAFWGWFSDQFPGLSKQLEKVAAFWGGLFTTAFEGIKKVAGDVIAYIKRNIETAISTIKGGVDKVKGFIGGLSSFDLGAAKEKLGFATGGLVRGPGTGTSDSILARLSNGEFVMTAQAVRNWGVGFMEAINSGVALPGLGAMAEPALVGVPSMASSSGGSRQQGDTVYLNIGGQSHRMTGEAGVGRKLQRELEAEERRRIG